MLTRTITAVVFAGLFAGIASADPILIRTVQDIHGSALVEVGSLVTADQIAEVRSERPGRFDADGNARAEQTGAAASASASQHTTIDAVRAAWFGSGSAAAATAGQADLIAAGSISVFDVDFLLREPTSFRFSGTFSASGPDTRVDSVLSGVWTEEQIASRTLTLRRSGVLPPGSYSFFAFAQSTSGIEARNTSGRAAFDFAFSLGGASPTPEPTPAALVVLALAIGCCWRASARRSSVAA